MIKIKEIKRVGFVAHGPASANALLPIINYYKNKKTEVIVLAYHDYVAKLWKTTRQATYLYPDKLKEADIIFYGTGSSHTIERDVALYGKLEKIKTVSILDIYWLSVEDVIYRHPILPDFLIVQKKELKEELEATPYFKECTVIQSNNPHFERLIPYIKERILTKNDKNLCVVFYSQCSTDEDFSDTQDECKRALIALQLMIQKDDYYKTYFRKNKIKILPHPREDVAWLMLFSKNNPYFEIELGKSEYYLYHGDILIGCSTTMLYEAEMIGKHYFRINANADMDTCIKEKLENCFTYKTKPTMQKKNSEIAELLQKIKEN